MGWFIPKIAQRRQNEGDLWKRRIELFAEKDRYELLAGETFDEMFNLCQRWEWIKACTNGIGVNKFLLLP